MEEEVGVLEEFEGGVEGGDNRRGELVDEADGVGYQDFVAIGQPDTTGDGVQGGEESVGGGDSGVGQGVEEGALAGVGVADERCHGEFGAAAPFTVKLSGTLDAFNLALESLDSAADEAPVGLNLGLAGAAGADAAAESFQVGPLAREAGEEVLVLGEFDLKLALASAGVAGEDIEDEGGAVDDLFADFCLEVALLGGAEFVVEDYDISFELVLKVAYFFQLALADVVGGGLFEALMDCCGHLRAGGVGELGEFVEGGFETPRTACAF